MTEAEWDASGDPGPMLALLESRPPPLSRKRKLLLCAAARHLLGDAPGAVGPALEAVEAWADALGEPRAPRPPQTDVYDALLSLDATREREQGAARLLALAAMGEKGEWATAAREACEPAALAGLLREVFRNPLRKILRVGDGMRRRVRAWPAAKRPRGVLFVPAWAAWHGGLPVRLAQGVAQRRAWDEMPVLGDALEEAGCDEPAVLEHLRGPGPHARGCWVLDLVLGKE